MDNVPTKTPFICRECGHLDTLPPQQQPQQSCPICKTARVLQHPELHDLTIAHVDCDAFYASIEKRDNPRLIHSPVIVGGGQDGNIRRGVVAAACYIARIYGVRSAMPIAAALKLCPDAVVIPPRMDKYRDDGYAIRAMMTALTPMVEPLSIDEAFLDLGGTAALHGASPVQCLIGLTKRIEDELGLAVSVGLAGNKSMAKIASDMDKPRGFHIIGVAEAEKKLAPLPVSILYGAGTKLAKRLGGLGIHTCGDLARANLKTLMVEAGSIAPILQQRARGIDTRKVVPNGAAKSISAETTFDQDTESLEELLSWLLVLAEKISAKMKSGHIAGRRVVLKLKTHDHKTITRSVTLTAPTQMSDTIFNAGRQLLERAVKDGRYWRLIGIGTDQLEEDSRADPLDLGDPDKSRRQSLEAAVDSLRAKHGAEAVIKGRRLNINQTPKK